MKDEQYQTEYFEFMNKIELQYNGPTPAWYKNESSRRKVFESQRTEQPKKKVRLSRTEYNREYQKKRRRLPDDMMNGRRPQSDVDPQRPDKPRKCMACRAEFMPRTNTLFRCDDCRRLHTVNPPAHTEIIY